MTVVQRGFQHGTDVLIRKVDSHVAALRPGLHGPDLELAERLAACLRELVMQTSHASAADRARVRAAVHYFVLRRQSRNPLLPARPLTAAQQMVNEVVLHLGRPDLLVESTADDRCPPDGGSTADSGAAGRDWSTADDRSTVDGVAEPGPSGLGLPAARRPGPGPGN
jgi:hypothetical protein